MSAAPAFSRGGGDGRAAAPVRHVHLGLGNFFRAHQAWYSDRAPDAGEWGIAAFAGRSAALADTLSRQDGLYTLVTRSAAGDGFEVISSVSAAHRADEHAALLRYLASPAVRLVTLTVTEAGYHRVAGGGLDVDHALVRADVAALRARPDASLVTVPGRLVAALAARWRAGAGPLSVLSCDNLAANGAVVAAVLTGFAELVDPALAAWLGESVSYVTTTVDRITPRTTDADLAAVAARTHRADRAPVVTEPFSEWVLSGAFAAGRPGWEHAGAVFTDDITGYEQRKLWLLNGGHSLLAYAGSIRGHRRVSGAFGDDSCRAWLEQWWDEAAVHLRLPAAEVAEYRAALAERFANPRIRHLLAQIAADGSQKLPVRVLPVIRAERAAGRVPIGALRILAAWICHLRGGGAPVADPRQAELIVLARGPLPAAVGSILRLLDVALVEDPEVRTTVRALAEQLCP